MPRPIASIALSVFAGFGPLSPAFAQEAIHELPGLTSSGGFGASLSRVQAFHYDPIPILKNLYTRLLIGSPMKGGVGEARIVSVDSTTIHRVHTGGAFGDQFGFSSCELNDLNNDFYNEYAIGAPWEDANGIDSGAVYVYDGKSGAVMKKLVGANAGDRFGFSLAFIEDVEAFQSGIGGLMVGAPYHNNGAMPEVGRATIYSTFLWNAVRTITGTAAMEHLGWSVDGFTTYIFTPPGSGFHSECFVGSPGHSNSRGRVQRVDTLSGIVFNTWTGTNPGDQFGYALRLVGSATDGTNMPAERALVIGKPGADNILGTDSGSVLCYSCWSSDTLLWKINGTVPDGRYGETISYVPGDLIPTAPIGGTFFSCVAVGAPRLKVGSMLEAGRLQIVRADGGTVLEVFQGDAPYAHMGAAASIIDSDIQAGTQLWRRSYAFSAPTAGSSSQPARVWTYEAGLDAPGGSPIGILAIHQGSKSGLRRGQSVAGLGDVNGDGRSDYACGSPLEDAQSPQTGAVALHSGISGLQILRIEGTESFGEFGASVAPGGDVNGDGVPDVVVGAPKVNVGGVLNTGGVYVYSSTGVLLRSVGGPGIGDELGRTVSGGGDLNHDGCDDFIAGAPEFDALATDAGLVRAYSGSSGAQLFSIIGLFSNGQLGAAVAIAGDVNLDGCVDFAAGLPGAGSGAGQARVYSGATGSLLHTLSSPDTLDLGRALAAGDLDFDGRPDLLAGARKKGQFTLVNQGAVLAFSGANGALLLNIPGKAVAEDNFGVSLAYLGDLNRDGFGDLAAGAVVGGPVLSNSQGAVRVYSGRDGLLLHEVLGEDSFDQFGSSLAAAGDLTEDGVIDWLAGAPDSDNGTTDSGGVWAYSSAPEGVSNYGTGTPGCFGTEPIWGNVTPKVGAQNFRVSLTNACPNSLALGIVSDQKLFFAQDTFFIGLAMHVGILGATTIVTLDLPTDAQGRSQAALPIPNIGALQGQSFGAQTISAWPAGVCVPSQYGLSSSRGLSILVN